MGSTSPARGLRRGSWSAAVSQPSAVEGSGFGEDQPKFFLLRRPQSRCRLREVSVLPWRRRKHDPLELLERVAAEAQGGLEALLTQLTTIE